MATGLRSKNLQRLPLLAGWLFADLFLVLFLVGLASSPAKPHPPRPSPSPAASPTPTPPRVLDRAPISFHVNVSPTALQDAATRPGAKSRLLTGLDKELRRLHLQGRRAGFVLVFASGPQSAIGQAIATAKSVVKLVRARNSAFAQASGLGYWSGSGNYIKFVVFFFAQPGGSGGLNG